MADKDRAGDLTPPPKYYQARAAEVMRDAEKNRIPGQRVRLKPPPKPYRNKDRKRGGSGRD